MQHLFTLNSETVSVSEFLADTVACMFRVSSSASLVHRGRVELEGLLQDVTFHVVFTLVYDVGLALGSRSDATARRVFLLSVFTVLQST